MNQLLAKKKIVVAGAGGLLGARVVKAILDASGDVIATDICLESMTSRLESIGVDISDRRLVAKN